LLSREFDATWLRLHKDFLARLSLYFLYDCVILTISFSSLRSVLFAEDLVSYIRFARSYEEAQSSVDKDAAISLTASTLSELSGLWRRRRVQRYFLHSWSARCLQGGGSVLLCRPTFWAHVTLPHGQGAVVPAQGTWSPAPFEGAMRSLYPSDYEGLEPRLGLEGCQGYGRPLTIPIQVHVRWSTAALSRSIMTDLHPASTNLGNHDKGWILNAECYNTYVIWRRLLNAW